MMSLTLNLATFRLHIERSVHHDSHHFSNVGSVCRISISCPTGQVLEGHPLAAAKLSTYANSNPGYLPLLLYANALGVPDKAGNKPNLILSFVERLLILVHNAAGDFDPSNAMR